MNWQNEYNRWLAYSEKDPFLKEELLALSDDREREDGFYKELEFGTAGLRGIIGAGTNRMNKYVVRRASAGLAECLLRIAGAAERGVAIAYDSRNFSDVFAMETALTLCSRGIRCYLFGTLHSVPQLSFAVRHLNCIAGVVITASHNPPEYNGYKVYWEDGGQCAPDKASEILAYIRRTDYFDVEPMPYTMALSSELLTIIGSEVDEAYYNATSSLMLHPECVKENGADIKVVYTPLHGSGYVPVTEMLRRIGVSNVFVVPEQAEPNGDFPTVKAPNPEDKNAFTLAIELADRVGASLILATDPDSDRLGVAVRKPDDTFLMLTGNQTGALLTHYILSALADKGNLPKNGLVVKSFVSTAMADAICKRFGVEIRDVLTGFRFISEWIDRSVKTGEYTFLFGFEESYGCLAGGFARDKDAVCAAMLICDAAVWYATNGCTLYDAINDMYREYGYYMEKVKSYTLSGKEGMEKIASAMKKLHEEITESIGGLPVEVKEDYLTEESIRLSDGTKTKMTLPKADAIRYLLPNGAWAVVRPSGTEPKLKLYIGAVGETEEKGRTQLDNLMDDMDFRISELLK